MGESVIKAAKQEVLEETGIRHE
ncbi:MAG: hypothetical protein KKD28_11855 [Chloroflexi bacterium]|nr:hypothetical protein [Chloroflexota bacterium]